MESIHKKRNVLAVLFISCAGLAILFLLLRITEGAILAGGAGVILLFLWGEQQRRYRDAMLIYDNPILTVPAAVITRAGGAQETVTKETVVSTFGVLTESEVFKWGRDGVRGTRLGLVEIDRAYISMTFGDGAKTARVKLPHGLPDRAAVAAVKERLLHETGIDAQVVGW